MKNNLPKLIYGKVIPANQEQGFITLEVIVALICGLAFFAFSLQAFGVAMAMKAQSQEKQRANELIQEDIERISQLGSNPALAGVCNPTGATPAAAYNNGYANGLWNALQAAAADNSADVRKTVTNKIKSDGSAESSGRTLSLQRVHVSNNAGAFDDPHRTLRIGYQVWYWDVDNNALLNKKGDTPSATDNAIAETYVEVIPDVALACP